MTRIALRLLEVTSTSKGPRLRFLFHFVANLPLPLSSVAAQDSIMWRCKILCARFPVVQTLAVISNTMITIHGLLFWCACLILFLKWIPISNISNSISNRSLMEWKLLLSVFVSLTRKNASEYTPPSTVGEGLPLCAQVNTELFSVNYFLEQMLKRYSTTSLSFPVLNSPRCRANMHVPQPPMEHQFCT